jgi:hypothetical protein
MIGWQPLWLDFKTFNRLPGHVPTVDMALIEKT